MSSDPFQSFQDNKGHVSPVVETELSTCDVASQTAVTHQGYVIPRIRSSIEILHSVTSSNQGSRSFEAITYYFFWDFQNDVFVTVVTFGQQVQN